MQFMLAMIGDEKEFENLSPEELQAFVEDIDAFNTKLTEAGALVSGVGLQDRTTAKTVRFSGSSQPAVTDGPFYDAREQLGGFWIVECASIDEAAGLAESLPLHSGAVEIRPVVPEV
jgi:hypothetical protein